MPRRNVRNLSIHSLLLLILLVAFCSKTLAQNAAPYLDRNLPVEQRVADLVSRMTLEEKIAQLEGVWQNPGNLRDPNLFFIDGKGNFLPDRATVLLKHGIGEMSRPSENRDPRAMAEFTNTMQKWLK